MTAIITLLAFFAGVVLQELWAQRRHNKARAAREAAYRAWWNKILGEV